MEYLHINPEILNPGYDPFEPLPEYKLIIPGKNLESEYEKFREGQILKYPENNVIVFKTFYEPDGLIAHTDGKGLVWLDHTEQLYTPHDIFSPLNHELIHNNIEHLPLEHSRNEEWTRSAAAAGYNVTGSYNINKNYS